MGFVARKLLKLPDQAKQVGVMLVIEYVSEGSFLVVFDLFLILP